MEFFPDEDQFALHSIADPVVSNRRLDANMNKPADEFPLAFCAAKFLRQWEKHEASLYCAISAAPSDSAISQALAYFQVARNFADLKKKPESIGKIRRALTGVRTDESLATEAEQAMALAQRMKEDFGQFNLSAATKLLWLSYRAPYIVHDRRAVIALSRRFSQKFNSRIYAEYATAWRAEYEVRSEDIGRAIASLPMGRAFMPRTCLTDEELVALSKEAWFKERVFDTFLWERAVTDDDRGCCESPSSYPVRCFITRRLYGLRIAKLRFQRQCPDGSMGLYENI